jgi:hypothetical protein
MALLAPVLVKAFGVDAVFYLSGRSCCWRRAAYSTCRWATRRGSCE